MKNLILLVGVLVFAVAGYLSFRAGDRSVRREEKFMERLKEEWFDNTDTKSKPEESQPPKKDKVLPGGCFIRYFKWQEAKICGDKVYNRNYACDNNKCDENIKRYREEYTSKGEQYCNDEWCGLKPFLEDHNDCEPVWDLNEYCRYTKDTVYWSEWGNCFDEWYYNTLTGERFSVGEFIKQCELPRSQGGYGGKPYALGSINLQLYLGSASEHKPTKEYSRCITKCFADTKDKRYDNKLSNKKFKDYVIKKCGSLKAGNMSCPGF